MKGVFVLAELLERSVPKRNWNCGCLWTLAAASSFIAVSQAQQSSQPFDPANAASPRTAVPAKAGNEKRHPYNSEHKPWAIPGIIEAENFDVGAPDDPAYFDDTPGSQAPEDECYRPGDVDMGVDPLMNLVDVGWINVGEWMEYTVEVKQAGRYTVAVRIATTKSGKSFHLEFNRKNVTGSVVVPNTGCWGSDLHGHDCFQFVTAKQVKLKKGIHRIRFVPEGQPGEHDLYTVDKFIFSLGKKEASSGN